MWSYLASRGLRLSLRNRHFPGADEWLEFFVNKQWLLRNNYRGPRLAKYDLWQGPFQIKFYLYVDIIKLCFECLQ